MNSFKNLLSASLLLLSAAPSLADGPGQPGESYILNNQINLQHNWSTMNLKVDTVGGDVVTQGAAGGNLVDIMTMNDTIVNNSQLVGSKATIRSTTTLDAKNVWGSVGVQNQVLCNGAGVSTDPAITAITSVQDCQAIDSFSVSNVNIGNIEGHAIVQNSMVGNSFQADTNARNMPINTTQTNSMPTISTITGNVFNVGGNVGFSSSAIGNTSQIIHYNTH
jgi:hypothetical protein